MARRDDQRRELGSLELISQHIERQLDLQWGHWDIIDARLRLLLGFVGAVFVAVLAFVANRASDLATATVGLVVAAIVLLMFCGLITGLAWLPREFDRPPKPSPLRQKYLGKPAQETLLAIADTMVQAYNDNERRIDQKLAAFRYAAGALAVAIFLIAVGAILELLK